ncbi:hypothetical protein SDC9_110821 [bioreactor metagenome]|uniref:Uncharacterized protein n=1 Tax=bioreactor metagenome TaxID=1076179 RepID=A0A645BFM0_9ZZZZ
MLDVHRCGLRLAGAGVRAVGAEEQPGQHPEQADDAEDAERPAPAGGDDDGGQGGRRDHRAEGRAGGDQVAGQRAVLRAEPAVGRGQRHGGGRPFGPAEHDPGHQQHRGAATGEHRELHHRPDHAHGEEDPLHRVAAGEEAGDDRDDRVEEEESASDEAELDRGDPQVRHGVAGHQAEDGLVRERDDLEQHQHGRDDPGPYGHVLETGTDATLRLGDDHRFRSFGGGDSGGRGGPGGRRVGPSV